MSDVVMDKAVILARGLGTRMRKTDETASLSDEQTRMADMGVKAMMPIDRPFLDYVLTAVADAGYRRVCLVIGPEHDAIREYYGRKVQLRRLSIDYAVQTEPLGTADAVAAAEGFAGADPFLVINSDNYYPAESLRALRELDGPGLAAFERQAMLDGSNIPPKRVTKFAVIEADGSRRMVRIVEKPDAATIELLPEPVCVSMNCWRFAPSIFQACRSIPRSDRGELEIPDAVQYSIEQLSETYRVLIFRTPVLDMSSRADVAAVAAKLAGTGVSL